MAAIVLHRLTDWPTFRHLGPLLASLGVSDTALEHWHYFFKSDAIEKSPFDGIQEVSGEPAFEAALLAVTSTFAMSVHQLVGASDDDELTYGFHWSATKEALLAAAEKAHKVTFVSDVLAKTPTTAAHLPPLFTKWELSALRSMLKETLEPASAKVAMRYIDDGGALPKLLRRAGVKGYLSFYFPMSDWTDRHERVLDVFVAATDKRACPVWSPSGERGQSHDDSAGRLSDALLKRGVSETVIFDALCKQPAPGSSQVGFGHKDWPSSHALLATWFGRLDEVVAMGPGRVAALFEQQVGFPQGLRILAGLLGERWCKKGGFAKLDIAGLAACTFLDQHGEGEAFELEAGRVHTKRVLGEKAPAMSDLIAVSWRGVPTEEKRRFEDAVKAAVARNEMTLFEWKTAKERELVSDATFAKGVVPAFERALAAGLKEGPHGFGDHEGFMAAAPAVGAANPDLCLRGLMALSSRFNEHGLKAHLRDWDSVLPRRGFSKKALEEATTHFSSPQRRSTAKILAKLLAARGIATSQAKPPAIESVDETFRVGTDVAHLLIGGYDAVEAVADVEDPDDWPGAIKRHKCVGLETGGDGQYTVRVLGAAPNANASALAKAKAKGATHVASFPFEIKGDALTVSGIVGAGGTPTIPFPSGAYAADVFAKDGKVTLVVSKTKKPPKWTFKTDLPHL